MTTSRSSSTSDSLPPLGATAQAASTDDHTTDLAIDLVPGYDPHAASGECVFDEQAARHALDFFSSCLTHVKGELAGQPFILEPWQEGIIANVFGWKRPDGTRRYREVFIYVGRKNGKTLIAGAICLYMLFCDGEPGAEIYCAAAERDQAALAFDVAKQMVLNEPVLAGACGIYAKSIAIEQAGSCFKAISADANTKHGYNSHCVVIDELHAQRTPELVDVLVTSTGARRQPLIIYITTADYDRPSICNDRYDYACKVRDGVIDDPSFLPVIYEANRDDDWRDPDVWKKANPNLGVSISEEYLKRECRRAVDSPAYENTFKRLHLNIRTEQDVRWLSLAKWDTCGGAFDAESLANQPCWAGLDLGSTSDLTSLCLLFPIGGVDKAEDGNDDDSDAEVEGYRALWWFWVPRENAEVRERRDRVPYLTWANQDYIELTPGDETDYRHIRKRVNEVGEQYQILEVAADRLFQGAQLCQDLADDGFEVVPFGQGFLSMAAPTQEFERLVNRGVLHHGDNPVVRWMASNVSVKIDPAGNMKPDKSRSAEKIDGIVAAIMALGRAIGREAVPHKSVYETRGILWIG
ncbi:MAG: terminase large subunit [Planctomycetes bacterium]|nr:terminase large subunit [Planctomycetota bacterium]NOG53133.1 terminase large subunit [Planctomycetota bacterium]